MVKKEKNILPSGRSTNRRDSLVGLLLLLTILLMLNVAGRFYYFRWDLTSEKRYSISKPTREMVRNLKDVVTVKVYLDGDLNAGFTRLKEATRNLLNELRAYGGKDVEYEFINPMGVQNLDERKALITDLIQRGLSPTNLTTKSKSESKQQLIFPGAIISCAGREIAIQLFENQIGYGQQDILNNSEIQLEYKFANAIQKLTQYHPTRISFLRGHGELSSLETADLRQTLAGLQYDVRDFDISRNSYIPSYVDAIIIAKPQAPFEEYDKYKIDQYIMRGGKTLWLLDGTNANMDSLRGKQPFQLALGNAFNLDDMLFKYGVRINTDVIQDINLCNQIPVLEGMGNTPQTVMVPWYYYPLLVSDNNHAITRNLDPVASFFPSSLDTIKNPEVTKTILLHTSTYSKAQMAPTRIFIGNPDIRPNPAYYNQPKLAVAVLLEGKFQSGFKNRLSSRFIAASDTIQNLKFTDQSKKNKMIVISNGDIIRNELRADSSFYPLGYYKFTRQQFANKDFILNCIEYLIDENGILEARNKDVKLRILNSVKVEAEKMEWQLVNMAAPVAVIILFGFAFNYYRRRKYSK